MELSALLSIQPGVTALIGSGGKTTAMYLLAEELGRRGRVICCTTTYIRRPAHLPVLTAASETDIAQALDRWPRLCLGAPAENGKLTAPLFPMARLAALADYVLVEADGSRGLPMKAHLPHEPVVPPEAGQTVLLVGASGFGRTVEDAAHRPEQFRRLSGLSERDPITPRAVADVIRREGLSQKIFVNQAETQEKLDAALALAGLLDANIFAGALKGGTWECLS